MAPCRVPIHVTDGDWTAMTVNSVAVPRRRLTQRRLLRRIERALDPHLAAARTRELLGRVKRPRLLGVGRAWGDGAEAKRTVEQIVHTNRPSPAT